MGLAGSSAASDVYKRQVLDNCGNGLEVVLSLPVSSV